MSNNNICQKNNIFSIIFVINVNFIFKYKYCNSFINSQYSLLSEYNTYNICLYMFRSSKVVHLTEEKSVEKKLSQILQSEVKIASVRGLAINHNKRFNSIHQYITTATEYNLIIYIIAILWINHKISKYKNNTSYIIYRLVYLDI